MNVFQLFGSISLDDAEYRRSLARAESVTATTSNRMSRSLQRVSDVAGRVGGALSRNLTAPIAAVGAAAVAATVQLGNYADRILDLEQMTGLATDTLQQFERVAIEAGVSTETLANSARLLTVRLSATGNESQTFSDALDRLGVSSKNSDGSLRSMDALLPDLLRGLSSVESVTERNALATDLFGRSASELAPVLALGADRINEVMQEAEDLGLVLDRDALNAANNFRIAQTQLRDELLKVGRQIAVALIPVLTKFVNFLQQNVVPAVEAVTSFIVSNIEAFSNMSNGMQAFISTVVVGFAAAGPFMLAVKAVSAALAALSAPIAIAIAAVVALVTAYRTNFLGLQNFLQPILESIGDNILLLVRVGKTVIQNWETIAWGFQAILRNMADIAGEVGNIIKISFVVAADAIVAVFASLGEDVNDIFFTIANSVINQINKLINVTNRALGRFGTDIKTIDNLINDENNPFAKFASDSANRLEASRKSIEDSSRRISNQISDNGTIVFSVATIIEESMNATDEAFSSSADAAEEAGARASSAFDTAMESIESTRTAVLNLDDALLNSITVGRGGVALNVVPAGFERQLPEPNVPILERGDPVRVLHPVISVAVDLILQEELKRIEVREAREAQRADRVAAIDNQMAAARQLEYQDTLRQAELNTQLIASTEGFLDAQNELALQLTARAQRGDGGLSEVPGLSAFNQAVQAASQFVGELGNRALNLATQSFPLLGNAIQAFATGGPLAALASIFMDLIGSTEGFQRLIEVVNRLLQPLINALEPFLNAIVNVVSALEPLFQIVGQLTQAAFAPLVFILENVVAPVFTWLANTLRTVYNALFGWLFGRIEADTGGGGMPDGVNGGDGEVRGRQAELRPDGSFRYYNVSGFPGSIEYYQSRIQALNDLINRSVNPFERERARNEIAVLQSELDAIRAEGTQPEEPTPAPTPAPSPAPRRRDTFQPVAPPEMPEVTTPGPVPSEQELLGDIDRQFGAAGQSVQLAVATPMIEAANIFRDVAVLLTGGIQGGSVYAAHTEAMREHTFWLSEMAREGMRVTVGMQAPGGAAGLPRYI